MNALSLERLHKIAPSIFTEGSANRTTNKYQHISTARLIDGLKSEGFFPVWAAQCRTRTHEKVAFTKHMLRFRHVDTRPSVGGLLSEIILVNSHDGLSSYRLMAGVYRLVCSNGLVAGNNYNEIRVRHQGDILGQVINGTYEVIGESKKMIEAAERMSEVKLDLREKLIFAESAHGLRFENSPMSDAIKFVQLLEPRRFVEHEKNDLFTVFNVIQENIIKGGIRGYSIDQNKRLKRVRSRAVTSIDQNNSLNRALWSLSEKMMQLKGHQDKW